MSAEGVLGSIGGGGSQAGSKESDGGTARWIVDHAAAAELTVI